VRVSFLVLMMGLAAMIEGCGGGGTSTPPPLIAVSVTAAANTAEVGSTITITAQVSNDSSNQGVNWTISPAPGTGSGVLMNATGDVGHIQGTRSAAVQQRNGDYYRYGGGGWQQVRFHKHRTERGFGFGVGE
jgi:hypothetical protein